jgi:ell wall binding domain 2 (CWB2)
MLALAAVCAALVGCGGGTSLITGGGARSYKGGVPSNSPQAAEKLGFPADATKNTTRVPGADPIADAAGVALAVFPSQGAGTHPPAVVIAPEDDWQASIAASVLMAPPIGAPLLLSGHGSLPAATSSTLTALAPAGSPSINRAQVIDVGDVPKPSGERAAAISGSDPYATAAAIDRFVTAADGKAASDVIIASGDTSDAAYAMPAAGYAAESGDPVLFVTSSSIPQPTRQALLAHQNPHIYVLGPSSVISNGVLAQLGKYGSVKRVGAAGAPANSVAFALYRDPPCPVDQACAHIPGSFGWALRGPGHGYVLLNDHRPLDAAAASALSSSGDYGPQLVIDDPTTLPSAVLSYFLNYATPGYNQEGPTAAVYNHGWVIGDPSVISVGVQAEMDARLEVVPQAGTTAGGQ